MTQVFAPDALQGKLALVTGSSRGIGHALATGLARAGARVLVHGRDEVTAKAAAEQIALDTGADTQAVTFDVTDPASVNEAFARIEAEIGPIDILVNNAGLQRRAPMTEFADDDWNEVIATNLSAAFYTARAVAKGMVQRGAGKIVNIGSVQSQLGRRDIVPYAASKGGIVMLTRGMCADLGPKGLQINCLAPGYIATEMTRALQEDEQFDAWVKGRTPAARWGSTEDLVGALVFLASSASDFVNGQTLFVDGGMTAVV